MMSEQIKARLPSGAEIKKAILDSVAMLLDNNYDLEDIAIHRRNLAFRACIRVHLEDGSLHRAIEVEVSAERLE
jgi:hypothetical protein